MHYPYSTIHEPACEELQHCMNEDETKGNRRKWTLLVPGYEGRGIPHFVADVYRLYCRTMKYITTSLLTLVTLSFSLTVGCKPANDRSQATETTWQETTRTEAATGQTARNWEAYTFEQRSQFVVSMEAELASINQSIDELAARIGRSDEKVQSLATPRLNELRNQADLLKEHIDEVKGASASTWEKVKATTHETYESLKNNFNSARQWMSDRIEP